MSGLSKLWRAGLICGSLVLAATAASAEGARREKRDPRLALILSLIHISEPTRPY